MFNQRPKSSTSSSNSSLFSRSSSTPVTEFSHSRPTEQTLLQDHFRCPILQEKMRDPVIAADGYTYEREAITQWIATRGTRALSPMTGERLAHLEIQDNILVRQMIAAYQDIKPQRQQRALTEKDIELACQLREEELRAMLEKQGRIIETIAQERDAVVRQFEPQQQKIEELIQENEYLRKIQNLPKDMIFMKLHSEIGRLEKQLENYEQGWAASIIQLHYHRHRLKHMMRDSWLHKEEEPLLNKKQEMEKALVVEQAILSEKLVDLVKKQQWIEVAKQSQLAEAHKQELNDVIQAIDNPLREMEKRKTEKREHIIKRTMRFYETDETKEKYVAAVKHTLQSQQQTSFQFGTYLSKREKDIFKFFESKGLLFQPTQKSTLLPSSSISSSSSASSIPVVIPLSALKTADGVSPAQMELQNQLTKACYGANVDIVKALVEKKGADPSIPDKDGQQPLGAAIWWLAFKVMDYLESKVNYTEQDWQNIAKDLQQRHGKLLPTSTRIVTYEDWVSHYNSQEMDWFYNYQSCKQREYKEIMVEWERQHHHTELIYLKPFRRVQYISLVTAGQKPNSLTSVEGTSQVRMVRQVDWLHRMLELMSNRFCEHGVKFDENYRLIGLAGENSQKLILNQYKNNKLITIKSRTLKY